jgi:hypothetical protein
MAHVLAGNIPNSEQHAVTFMIARTILVWLTKITERDWAVGCRNDFREQDLFSRASQNISTANTAF